MYPHPALIELTGAPERLKYKAAKVRRYWPELPPHSWGEKLIETWQEIIDKLESKINGVFKHLPRISADATGRELKSLQDMLDAIVWVGIETVEGHAIPFGDQSAAIWISAPGGNGTVTAR